MLTATYSIVAMSVEQANVRTSVNALHQLVRTAFAPEVRPSPRQYERVCAAMQHIYDAFSWRKVERFLIPAVRQVTRAADRLLEELDRLKLAAADSLGALLERTRADGPGAPAAPEVFGAQADAFCRSLLLRLEREEQALFPLARASLSSEAWFAIANQIIEGERDREDAAEAPPPARAARAARAAALSAH